MAKKAVYTAQLFDDLFVDAMGGDSVALDEYRDAARKLAKQINQQLLQAERAGIETEAGRLASSFLGDKKRFKERGIDKLSMQELQDQVDAMLRVRSTRDYSLPYAITSQEQIEALSEAMQAAGVDLVDKHVAYQMNEMFKTGAWKEYKKAHGRSTDLIQAAQDQFKKGKTVDDLLAAHKDYSEGRDDLTESAFKFFGRW